MSYNTSRDNFEAKLRLMKPPKAPKRPKIDVLGVKVADISQKEAASDIILMAKSYKKG